MSLSREEMKQRLKSQTSKPKPIGFLPREVGDSPHLFKVNRGSGVEFVIVTEDGRIIKAEDY
jgi:hypothetical protein